MRAQEFIITLPIEIATSNQSTAATAPQENPAPAPAPAPAPVDDNVGKFIPPLQQKIELLKKGVGVESEFDGETADSADNTELDAIKRNAGISPAVIHVASDDEPLE